MSHDFRTRKPTRGTEPHCLHVLVHPLRCRLGLCPRCVLSDCCIYLSGHPCHSGTPVRTLVRKHRHVDHATAHISCTRVRRRTGRLCSSRCTFQLDRTHCKAAAVAMSENKTFHHHGGLVHRGTEQTRGRGCNATSQVAPSVRAHLERHSRLRCRALSP